MQIGKREAGGSKRAAQRLAERERERSIVAAPVAKRDIKLRMAKQAAQVGSARPDHLHVSSAEPRKEKSRETCKERPQPSGKKGNGKGSRPFVPWCSRRR